MAQTAEVADPAATVGLQQITVTARKRAEVQLDVPISIRTLTEGELRASGVTDISALAQQSGFNFTSASGTSAYGRAAGMLTFRGLQGELATPNQNSGGVFLDGIAITGGIATQGFTDVAQVEVLKGPQNAFFGRSTFGGAVNFITRAPSTTLRGAINTTITEAGSTDADASIEGPLLASGMLRGRLSVATHNKQATAHASDGGDLGAESSRSASGMLYFAPTEDLWMRLRTTFQTNDDSQAASAFLAADGSCTGKTFTGKGRDGASVTYTPGNPYFCGSIPSISKVGERLIDMNTVVPAAAYEAWVNNSLNAPFFSSTPKLTHTGMLSEFMHASYQLGYALSPDLDLAVNAGYNQNNTTAAFDLDRTKTNNLMSMSRTPTKDLTVDARISNNPASALRWLVGVSRYTSTYRYSQIDYSPGLNIAAPYVSAYYSNFDSTVPAVYGSVEYDITKQLTATFEARYQQDKIESWARDGSVMENESTNFLPRFTLRFKPSAGTSFYANVAKGVQPLTTNSGYTSANAAGKAMLAELIPGISDFTPQPKLTAFELGVKQRIGNTFQYALAVYDQKWTDRLTSTNVFNPAGCTTYNTVDCPLGASGAAVQFGNDARIRGVELALDAQITPQLSAGANIDYKQAKWDKYYNGSQSNYGSYKALALTGAAVSFDGNKVGRVPDWQLAANTTYRFPVSAAWQAYVRGDLSFTGKQWESDFNFAQLDSFSRVDLRLGFDKGEQSVEFFVKNLADDRSWMTVARANNLGLYPLTSYANMGVMLTAQEGRTFGVRMRYAF